MGPELNNRQEPRPETQKHDGTDLLRFGPLDGPAALISVAYKDLGGRRREVWYKSGTLWKYNYGYRAQSPWGPITHGEMASRGPKPQGPTFKK